MAPRTTENNETHRSQSPERHPPELKEVEASYAFETALNSIPHFSDDRNPDWNLYSWREKPVEQNPEYADTEELNKALKQIRVLPPLVTFEDVIQLKRQLSEVQSGHRFLIQAGDCAEVFAECNAEKIKLKMTLLTQLCTLISWSGGLPTIRIGRIAGQYAKPRTCLTEELPDGSVIPAFRGDIINGFGVHEREPDPRRLVHAYHKCAETHQHIRSIWKESDMLSELKEKEHWDLSFMEDAETRRECEVIADQVRASLARGDNESLALEQDIPLYVSHEGLLLPFEEALCRKDEASGQYYCSSAHFLWIGERTRQLENAHVEFFRGVANPLGIKVGPGADPDEIVALCKRLNPRNENGKITLITRLGCDVQKCLVPLIKVVRASGIPVSWQCDPMHGNAKNCVVNGKQYKVRHFADILKEFITSFRVHESLGSKLMGIHLEMTGVDVTECLGGGARSKFPDKYETVCDPRLNREQAMELAFRAARKLIRYDIL